MKKSLIHVKLDYGEALDSKEDILSTEMSLLRIIKRIKQYKATRMQELKLKAKLHRKIKETITDIRKIEKNLPEADLPEIKTKSEEKNIYNLAGKVEKEYDSDLERQLREIQEKLNQIRQR